jgi:predicted RNA-binding Zn-ribbon protein involved in translation (DUF1610 family)
MDSVKAICSCNGKQEDDLVLAIREKPLERWGFWTWTFVILFVLVTTGGALPFVTGWVMGRYWLDPTYRCQHCEAEIEKTEFRAETKGSTAHKSVESAETDPAISNSEKTTDTKEESQMIYCWGCSNEIHETATSCPHCGANQGQSSQEKDVKYESYGDVPFYRKSWFVAVSFFLIPIVMVLVLITGDAYYVRDGKLKSWDVGGRIGGVLLSSFYMWALIHNG